jgi:phage terminase large subunit GpA-like protein
VIENLANLDAVTRSAMESWRPPPKLTLSQWADEHFYLSAESAAEPGRWRTIPYQRGMMDAITDPSISYVYVIKSARVGYTKILDAAIGYYMHQDPCPMLVVQPTVDDAKGFSKEEIAPMIRDCPVLTPLILANEEEDVGPKAGGNTILHKKFPGGILSLVGANSGAGFRRISRRCVFFDEVDAYPPSAGSDGDPIKLGTKRTEYYWNRKIIAGSTPLVAGRSRIEELFKSGDQRRYFVPCPECGHMAPLVFRGDEGHRMTWPKGKPDEAFFTCQKNGCVIEHKHKRDLVERGEWRATADGQRGVASFHIWAAYSYSPNASWSQLAAEFEEANKAGTEQLKTFVNTALGETWVEQGDAPEWERLYNRREQYQIGSVPTGVEFITAGVDVQKDSFRYEVVGWGAGKVSWSLECGVIPCDTSDETSWMHLDQLLSRTYPGVTGLVFAIRMLAVDSGFNTQTVYSWARKYTGRVIAVKGVSTAKTLTGTPTPVDVTFKGKRIARGCKVWPVGVDIAKSEFYGWLRLPFSDPTPNGFCHFPEYGEDYFRQITSEQLVTTVTKQGFQKREWQLKPGVENHFLDARIYARAAASVLGVDRMVRKVEQSAPVVSAQVPTSARVQIPDSQRPSRNLPKRANTWLNKRR